MKRSYKEVLPDQIIATDHTVQPTRAMIENIKINGIIEPLLVVPVYASEEVVRYNILSGLRRFSAFMIACRELHEIAQLSPATKAYQRYERQLATRKERLARVPVIVFEEASAEIILIGNSLRAKNPLHELEAIEEIQKRMLETESEAMPTQRDIEKEITRTTGMTAATQRNRLRLQNLIPELRTCMALGQMSPTVADGAARLNKKLQRKLLRALREKQETMGERATITPLDLREAQSIEVKSISRNLFANLDLSEPAPEPNAP